jgi:hypothetical protein
VLGIAALAVDGSTDGNFIHGSCTHTDTNNPAWWAVDLGQEIQVGRVRITNRGDCCAERLQNFNIGLTNVSPWTTPPNLSQSSICKYYTGYPPGGVPTDIFCQPNTAPGRYLFIMLPNQAMNLCEVEVFLN